MALSDAWLENLAWLVAKLAFSFAVSWYVLLPFVMRRWLGPWMARTRRGAWAQDPRYFAREAAAEALQKRAAGESDGDDDEPPELVPRDPVARSKMSYSERKQQRRRGK